MFCYWPDARCRYRPPDHYPPNVKLQMDLNRHDEDVCSLMFMMMMFTLKQKKHKTKLKEKLNCSRFGPGWSDLVWLRLFRSLCWSPDFEGNNAPMHWRRGRATLHTDGEDVVGVWNPWMAGAGGVYHIRTTSPSPVLSGGNLSLVFILSSRSNWLCPYGDHSKTRESWNNYHLNVFK